MEIQANILDPIHDGLDPSVFDHPDAPEPLLKKVHRHWIEKKIKDTLKEAGYHQVDSWLTLVLTGSLTTYQYSPESDVDVSLFVDSEHFPDWSRAEMIGIMVEHVDGTKLPGTTHPMQCFVVAPEIKPEDLYQHGLRSGYDIGQEHWIIPPERGRVHDVKTEMNNLYVYALESKDKMERLLEYEPDKAVQYWHQIHRRRQRDHRAGKGDYSASNIVYKYLANAGLFPQISELSGEYIAKVASESYWHITRDPYFKINPNQSPTDSSSTAFGDEPTPGLMVTQDPHYWASMFHSHPDELGTEYENDDPRMYAAEIDLSNLDPDEYWRPNRGYGDEVWVNAPEKARVKQVLPLDQALSRFAHSWVTPRAKVIRRIASDASPDELHIFLGVPADVRKQIKAWVDAQDWPEETKLEDPSDYHVTLLYSPDGYEVHKDRQWVKSHEGHDIKFTKVDEFGEDEEKAIVLRIDNDKLKQKANELQDKAEEEGLEISKFPGGYKPHLTVAYGPKAPTKVAPDIEFTSEGSEVSTPRVSSWQL